jgi:protein TonB
LPELPTGETTGLDPAEANDAASTGPPGSGGSNDGALGGVPGGEAGGRFVPGPPEPIPARPADLASVRSGIARTLVYPPDARRAGLQGRVLVAFVVLANGRIRDLTVREGCGHEALDAAALRAIEEAAPFTPPGMDVRVVLPLSFRIN